VFNKKLYQKLPDNPGGGTVSWTNPGEVISMSIILKTGKMVELLVLQVIKTALTIQLKEQMGIDNIMKENTKSLPIYFQN
jgi:hypothetical protein